MRIAKYASETGSSTRLGLVEGDRLRPIGPSDARLIDLLHADDPPDARR